MLPVSQLLSEGGVDPSAVKHLGVDPAQTPVRLAPWFVRAFWAKGISAMTVPWVIWVDPEVMSWSPQRRARLMVHELAHAAQWKRLGPGRFLSRYLTDYLRGRLKGMTHMEAYRAIGFEQEANAVRDEVLAQQT